MKKHAWNFEMENTYGQFEAPVGYRDLGWENIGLTDQGLADRCDHPFRTVNNSLHSTRGTDVIRICDTCKFLFHVDSSD